MRDIVSNEFRLKKRAKSGLYFVYLSVNRSKTCIRFFGECSWLKKEKTPLNAGLKLVFKCVV